MTFFRTETRGAVASGSPTYNPFENPSTPLSSVGFDYVWGRKDNDAGITVTTDTAIALPIVYRCISLLSTVIAGCPIDVYRKSDQELIQPFALFDSGNTAMTYTQFELWELVVAYLCGWGNAFVYKKRNPYDGIIDLKPIYPDLVEVKPGPDGSKVFLVKRTNDDGSIDNISKPQVFTDWEIMHIPGLGYNGLTGMSPIKYAEQTIGTAIAADKLAAKFYSAGTQLGGIIKIKVPLRNQTQADRIKARWMQKNAGVAHAGDVAILDAESDWQDVTIPPDQLQFLESRRWQTTEIARLFGIPPHLVGDVEKSTSWGTGIEQQNIGFIAYTISGWINRIEQRLTREIVATRGQYARFNLEHLMRGDTAERYQAYAQALASGWISADEIRKKEQMKPLGGQWAKPFPPAGLTSPVGQGPSPAKKFSAPQNGTPTNGKQNATGQN